MKRDTRFHISRAAASIVIVFLILSVIAISSALLQDRPEWAMPLWGVLIINESLALAGTLVYGIILHVVPTLIKRHKS